MEPNVSFFGRIIPQGDKKVSVVADFDDDTFETIHLTQVALGSKPTKGPHTVFVEREGEKYSIGTLDKEKCLQFSIDLTLATDTVFLSHTGDSEVHITGYRTSSILEFGDDGDDYDFMSGEEFSSEDDDSESGEESDSESDEDDDEAPRALPLTMADLQNGAILGSSDDEDEDVDASEEEGEDDSSEEESEEEEEEEEDAMEEEGVPAAAAPTAHDHKKNEREISKRKAAAQTPQPQKKAKTEVAKAPATAPAKTGSGGGGGTPSTEAEYSAAVRAFLEKNGPTKLAILGSNVKRPASASKSMKLKALVTNRPDFEYKEDDQTVTLKL